MQNQAQARVDRGLQARRERASVPGEVLAVEGQDLGDVDDRVAGKSRGAGGQQNIAWGIGKRQVTGDHGDYDGLNAAAIEGVGLHDQHRPAESPFGAARRGEIGPPDLAAMDVPHRGYQESLSRDLSWAWCNGGSTFAGRRE